MARHYDEKSPVGRQGPGKAAESRASLGRLWRGVALSLIVHAAWVLGLELVHPAVPPDLAVVTYDVTMVTAEPEHAPPAAIVEPEQQPSAQPEPAPPPLPAPVQPPPAAPLPQAAAPEEKPPVPAPPEPPTQPAEDVPAPLPPQPQPTPPPSPPTPARSPVHTSPLRPRTITQGQAAPATEAAAPPATATSPTAPAPLAEEERSSPVWLANVTEWLLAHRSYPEMARRLGRQGTVLVRFTVDREGHVLDVSLAQGSGSELLDQAAQALLRNAHLPPFPPDMRLPRQSVTVPIRYRLD